MLNLSNDVLVGKFGRAGELCGPALVVEKDTFFRNLHAMAERCTAAGVALRPHAKTHKSARVAREQISAGAVGICCATANEAITLGRLGIDNILLTTPVTEQRKISALVALASEIALGVVVDHVSQLELWERALDGSGTNLNVLVDVDIGMRRTGARGGDVVALAKRIQQSHGMTYAGIQAYSGMVQHIEKFDDRETAYRAQLETLREIIEILRVEEAAPEVVSGGGTGTMDMDLSMGLMTEVQFGSYVFMDVEYSSVKLLPKSENPFGPALFVRSAVISANASEHLTINAGFKSLSTDGPLPQIRDETSTRYEFFGDEYGRISGSKIKNLKLGDHIDIVVPHCDPTVCLHDYYHLIDHDTLVDIWTIDARGPL
ncbi:DSD1 family PLP-dependent enzyme [Paraburkholderia sediminicola]|uniref:DSD1 family PLP-dependent enzyme n=1 Tax=Paraburkholderia sediminicola TaxID=458836 RepID=UPI0038B7B4DD